MAVDENFSIELQAKVDAYNSAMRSSAASARDAADAANHTKAAGASLGATLTRVAKTAAVATAAGALASVLAIGKVGMAYEDSLNTFQAVTKASSSQMKQLADRARQLGADMTLPATSAAGAAKAMTELAKGGLSVKDSMNAALGTLRLAAAAQIDGAQAAQIQVNALQQFRLGAEQATHVADLLANVANSASGEITDVALALGYVGPVAAAMGEKIDGAATAIALLAQNGVIGEKAGTGLRSVLASLTPQSDKAAAALKALGIRAFDQKGQFLGLRTVTDQLATAKGRLSQAEFLAATSAAFGRESMSALNALANAGVTGFDKMAASVTHAGGATEVAAAKSKGLRGAFEGLLSQLETVAVDVYAKFSKPVEEAVRTVAEGIPGAVKIVSDSLGRISTAVGGVVVDLTPMATSLYNQARGAGQRLIDGVQAAVQSGNYGPMGKTLGEGIAASLNGAVAVAGKITEAIGRLLDQVKWSDLAVKLGKQAPLVLVSFAFGLLSFNPMPILKFLGNNWFEVLVAIFTTALLPARVLGVIVGLLGKIPLAGPFLKWGAEGFIKLSDFIGSATWGVLKFLGRGFAEGFGKVGPGIMGGFSSLGKTIGAIVSDYSGILVRSIGSAIKKMGTAAVRALGLATREILDGLAATAKGITKDVANLLVDAGKALVKGLVKGIKSAGGLVGGALKDVGKSAKNTFTSFFGISSPSTVFAEYGANLVDGLVLGINSRSDAAISAARLLARSVSSAVTGALTAADLKGAQARANETPVQRAQLADLTAGADLASAQKTAAAANAASKAASSGLAGLQGKAAAAHAALTRLLTSTSASTAAARDHARALAAQAASASYAASRMPSHTSAQKAAKAAAEAHASSLSYQAAQASRAATGIAQHNAIAVKAAREQTAAADKAYTAAKAKANAAAASASEANKAVTEAAAAAAQAHAALADAVYSSMVSDATSAMAVLKGQVSGLVEQANALKGSFSSAALAGTSLGDLFKAGTEGAGVLGVESVIYSMQARLAASKSLAADLASLQAAGLGGDLLKQISDAGLQTGSQIAQSILGAGPDAIATLNELSAQLALTASTAMDPVASALYGAGANAAFQAAEGLRSQFPELQAALDEMSAMITSTFPTAAGGTGGAIPAPSAGAGGSVTIIVQPAPTILNVDGQQLARTVTPALRDETAKLARIGA